MISADSLLAVILFAFAGVARASTPPGTVPANSDDLIVTFGNLLAMNGKAITITEANKEPVIGLSKQTAGTSYTVFMVDLDANYLHWAQSGLTTSSKSLTVSGTTFYPLENSAGVTALQSYVIPGPPAGPAHRYTQYLMSTTNSSDLVVSQSVATSLQTRINVNVTQLFAETGKPLVASNWWNTSRTAATNTSTSSTGSSPKKNGSLTNAQSLPNNASGFNIRDTIPLLAGLGGLAAIFSLL